MPRFANESDFAIARDVFARANFSATGISETLQRNQVLMVRSEDLPAWLRLTNKLEPLDTLIRLFLMGVSVPAQAVAAAIEPMSIDSWCEAGLIEMLKDGSAVEPAVRVIPIDGMLLVSDRVRDASQPPPSNFVMPPSITTLETGYATIRSHSARTLDLGTGCGALGILAATHSDHVVLTDTNENAIEFSKFNARLNNLENVECRTGSLFEPLAKDEPFDLILCNPPFVISPSSRYEFRDAGMRGDEFCKSLIRHAPDFMSAGGFCQLKCNFAQRFDHDSHQELTQWFQDLGCDVLVWTERVQTIADYAMTWIIGTESQDPHLVPQLFEQWMDFFQQQQIQSISYLFVVMRRNESGTNWIRIDGTPRQITGPCGDEILSSFAWQDQKNSFASPHDLFDLRVRLSNQVLIQQEHLMTDDGLRPAATRLCKIGGTRFVIKVDHQIGGLVARLDGANSVGEMLSAMARALGQDETSTREEGIEIIESLLDRGILQPIV